MNKGAPGKQDRQFVLVLKGTRETLGKSVAEHFRKIQL